MRAVALTALSAVTAACAPRGATPAAKPIAAGMAIALYAEGSSAPYAVVDDRRWVDVSSNALVLEDLDPGATLASLVIEPLTREFHIGACARDRIPALPPNDKPARPAVVSEAVYAPSVHCAVDAAPGRYLVRVVYVSTTLAYSAEHAIAMTAPDRATVTTRFAIATPAWRKRADVALFDGLPGGEHPPREVARGSIALDGTTSVLIVPPRAIAAQLHWIYDGAVVVPGVAATEPMWAHDSVPAVWVWLELAALELAPGPLRVHVELPGEVVRDIDVPAAGRRQAATMLRAPLWIDDSLRGMRQRFSDVPEGSSLADRFLMSIANTGDAPREVWVEEHLRPARRRRVERAWPAKPIAVGDVLRDKLEIRPGKIERAGFTVAYEF